MSAELFCRLKSFLCKMSRSLFPAFFGHTLSRGKYFQDFGYLRFCFPSWVWVGRCFPDITSSTMQSLSTALTPSYLAKRYLLVVSCPMLSICSAQLVGKVLSKSFGSSLESLQETEEKLFIEYISMWSFVWPWSSPGITSYRSNLLSSTSYFRICISSLWEGRNFPSSLWSSIILIHIGPI